MKRYLTLTRSHSYSLLFALPLFILYEAGAVMSRACRARRLRNGADVLLRMLLSLAGCRVLSQ